jgi:hypothetical protein
MHVFGLGFSFYGLSILFGFVIMSYFWVFPKPCIEHVQFSKSKNLVFWPWNYENERWHVVHSSSPFVVVIILFASSVQYANLVLIVSFVQQPFLND